MPSATQRWSNSNHQIHRFQWPNQCSDSFSTDTTVPARKQWEQDWKNRNNEQNRKWTSDPVVTWQHAIYWTWWSGLLRPSFYWFVTLYCTLSCRRRWRTATQVVAVYKSTSFSAAAKESSLQNRVARAKQPAVAAAEMSHKMSLIETHDNPTIESNLTFRS